MDNKLKPVLPGRGDAFTIIQKYMAGNQEMELTADAERMLKRLMFADALFRTQKKTADQICKELQETFSISEFTALKDIKNAQRLFATVRNINKTYLTHLHLERINQDIEMTRERLFWEESYETPGVKYARVPDAKELAALAKLEDVYTYTLNSAPAEKQQEATPPPVFQFVLVKGAEINTTMNLDEALATADKLLAEGSQIQDVDFQDVSDQDVTDQDDDFDGEQDETDPD